METNVLIKELEARLSVYEAELNHLEAKLGTVRPIVTSLRAAIEALKSTIPQDTKTEPLPFVPQPVPAEVPSPGFVSRPLKRSAYENKSIIEASRIILSDGRGIHADDITKAIYECYTPQQVRIAKHSVVSELLRGVTNGIFDKVGTNRFALRRKRQEAPPTAMIRSAS